MACQLCVKKLFEKEKMREETTSRREEELMLHKAKKYITLFKILPLLFPAHRTKQQDKNLTFTEYLLYMLDMIKNFI